MSVRKRVPSISAWLVVVLPLAFSATSEGILPPEPSMDELLALRPLPGNLGPLPARAEDADPELIHLGKVLFFDARLSPSGTVSCSTCHQPSKAWTDGLERAQGNTGTALRRNTPTVLNTGFLDSLFWDGRARTLEQQAREPLLSLLEHGFSNSHALEAVLNGIPYYVERFQKMFGTAPDMDHASRAIAAFERSLTTPGARFDRFVAGESDVFTEQEKHGLALFIGKAACTLCHQGPMFTDGLKHKLAGEGDGADAGIRTPGLRNVALTSPYMHDGHLPALSDVVDFYDRGGTGSPNQSPLLFPLGLDAPEREALVTFLHTLTGEVPIEAAPVEAVHGAHEEDPPPETAVNFIPAPPDQFASLRELMSLGIHDQFSFLGFNLWHAGTLTGRSRAAVAASAENLAALAARASTLHAGQAPLSEDRTFFEAGILELEGVARSLARAAQFGARPEVASQFERLEAGCNRCHARFRPDLVWTGAHE